MKNQKEFVEGCYHFYSEEGIIPGNPSDGEWEDAHYPVPECLDGTATVLLLKEHHFIHGIIQSAEFSHQCFYTGNTKHFLLTNFCANWFELFEVYEKTASQHAIEMAAKVHEEKDENGKSLKTKSIHEEKDENGKSVLAMQVNAIIHEEKNKDGKSIHTLKICEALHKEKDEDGKSILAKKMGRASMEKLHKERTEDGKSAAGVKAAGRMNVPWICTVTGYISTPAGLTHYQKARNIDVTLRKKVV
jgi:hypothetical protein